MHASCKGFEPWSEILTSLRYHDSVDVNQNGDLGNPIQQLWDSLNKTRLSSLRDKFGRNTHQFVISILVGAKSG